MLFLWTMNSDNTALNHLFQICILSKMKTNCEPLAWGFLIHDLDFYIFCMAFKHTHWSNNQEKNFPYILSSKVKHLCVFNTFSVRLLLYRKITHTPLSPTRLNPHLVVNLALKRIEWKGSYQHQRWNVVQNRWNKRKLYAAGEHKCKSELYKRYVEKKHNNFANKLKNKNRK